MNMWKELLDLDLLQMLASELGIGVLIMVWLEARKLRREAARLRHHLARKWKIYVMVTTALDVQMQGHVVDAAEKAQN